MTREARSATLYAARPPAVGLLAALCLWLAGGASLAAGAETAAAAGLRGSLAPDAGPRPYRPGASEASAAAGLRGSLGPALFGTVALPVGRTPFDARWRAARAGAVTPPAWRALPARLAGLPVETRAQAVNSWVNSHVAFAEDQAVYGRADHWASAAETAVRGRGDCEDFAIAKMQLLRAAGVPAGDLFLVIARDLVSRRDHAVLAIRVAGRFLVLDNRVDRLLPGDRLEDFRPIVTLSEDRAWTHGYPSAPTVTYAAAGGD